MDQYSGTTFRSVVADESLTDRLAVCETTLSSLLRQAGFKPKHVDLRKELGVMPRVVASREGEVLAIAMPLPEQQLYHLVCLKEDMRKYENTACTTPINQVYGNPEKINQAA